MELTDPLDPAEVLQRLAAVSPPGLDWIAAEANTPGRPAQATAVSYSLSVPAESRAAASDALAHFLAQDRWPYTRNRQDRTTEIDLRPFVLEAHLEPGGILRFRLKMTPDGSARPEEIVDALGLKTLLGLGAILARTSVELAP